MVMDHSYSNAVYGGTIRAYETTLAKLKASPCNYFVKLFGRGKSTLPVPTWFLYSLVLEKDLLFCFLWETGLIKRSAPCPNCGKEMTIVRKGNMRFLWNCGKWEQKKKCYGSKSLKDGSWFAVSHLTFETTLLLTHKLLHETPYEQIRIDLNLSFSLITDFTNYIKETLLEHLENHSECVGGAGVVIEIEESQMGQRKFNRVSQFVEGQWVLGGLQRGATLSMFLTPIPDRTGKSLTECIKKWVQPGTVVYSHSWNARDRLGEQGYKDLTESHSLHFFDRFTERKVTNVEIRNFTPIYNGYKGTFQNYLGQLLFKRLQKLEKGDPFLRFIDIVSQIDWSSVKTSSNRMRKEHEIPVETVLGDNCLEDEDGEVVGAREEDSGNSLEEESNETPVAILNESDNGKNECRSNKKRKTKAKTPGITASPSNKKTKNNDVFPGNGESCVEQT